jgi:hypothetical protein
LEAFDARQLADWPAQTYDVSLEDASLTARAAMRALLEKEIREDVGSDVHQLKARFHKVDVDWFKLVLVPVWRAAIECRDARFNAVVSGQTGHVWTDVPRTGVLGWVERLLGS